MINRDKVLLGIGQHIQGSVWDRCDECPYYSPDTGGIHCRDALLEDLFELIGDSWPRVMTLEEVEALPYGHVLIETDKSGSLRWLDALLFCKNVNFSFDFITLEGRARLLRTEYNREWRCWTARPTDAQRKATAWE